MGAAVFPSFLRLGGRDVVVVGGGQVAAGKVRALLEAGARVTVVAPDIRDEIAVSAAVVRYKHFVPGDLDGAWFVVAAATPAVNRLVAAAAEGRRLLVNAVDDIPSASAFGAATIRRGPVTIAISTGGVAPALAGLLREALEALLPDDVAGWARAAAKARPAWKASGVPLDARRPLLLALLNRLYEAKGRTPEGRGHEGRGKEAHVS